MSSLPETRSRTRELVAIALFTALLAAVAPIVVPLGPVPFTLQVFVVTLAALLLRPSAAAVSVGLYLVLGALGAPVFSGGNGGIGVILGPTGGYLGGFLVGAVLGAFARRTLARRIGASGSDLIAATVCIACIYSLGWFQLSLVAQMGAAPAFAVGVAPFAVADLVKAVVAIGVASAVRRAGLAAT